jgi:hypothetical protein
MPGGLIQLVAYGIENQYLTEEPQITFFKIVYRRHTNFSIESIPQYFNIKANFSNRISCTIAKNGDLINCIYIALTLPSIPLMQEDSVIRWVDNIGYAIINNTELEIGGKIIDTHYSDWLYIWNELNKNNNIRGINKMIGNDPLLSSFSTSKNSYLLYIPLQFWFCRNIALSLPIIALTYSEVKINIEFNSLQNCIVAGPTHYIYISDCICLFNQYELVQIDSTTNYIQFINFNNATMMMGYIKTNDTIILSVGNILTGCDSKYKTSVYNPTTLMYASIITNIEIINLTKSNTIFRNIYNLSITDAFLYVDYIYLDNIERMKFAKSNHEYLIDLCQYDNDRLVYNSNNKIKIGYCQPVKELIIRAQYTYMINAYNKNTYNYTTSYNQQIAKSLIKTILIKLNGFDREKNYDNKFYTYVQALQHHKSYPPLGLFMYSFALNPFDFQPSGSCNFSKIDDIIVDVTLEQISYNNPVNIRIYAFTYNIFRIINGVGGLAFDN